MPNSYFQFKQFTIQQDHSAMKVTTDACLFGAWAAKEIENRKSKIENLLDVGVGTGLLSLMISQKNPGAKIDAIEIDKDSFEQAKENIKASPWSNSINIFNGDTRNFKFSQQYDIIISNPPFYENELKSNDEKRNIALHGNELTLEELLRVIQSNLLEKGIFFLLLPYKRQDEIRKIFQQYQFDLLQIIFVRPSSHEYFRMMIMGSRKSTEPIKTTFDEISIWNEKQQYTNEFIELLKDYYLYL